MHCLSPYIGYLEFLSLNIIQALDLWASALNKSSFLILSPCK